MTRLSSATPSMFLPDRRAGAVRRRWTAPMTSESTKATFCVRGVISPLLANLFLHYAFDIWMQRHFPGVRFERYANDAIVDCRTEQEAREVLDAIRGRFEQCR